jgi:glutathione synthase
LLPAQQVRDRATDMVFENYPPTLSQAQSAYLGTFVKNWTAQNGLLVRPSTSQIPESVSGNSNLATNAPVSLFPSPFPRRLFRQAQDMQTEYNELYAAVASSEAFLESVMKS